MLSEANKWALTGMNTALVSIIYLILIMMGTIIRVGSIFVLLFALFTTIMLFYSIANMNWN